MYPLKQVFYKQYFFCVSILRQVIWLGTVTLDRNNSASYLCLTKPPCKSKWSFIQTWKFSTSMSRPREICGHMTVNHKVCFIYFEGAESCFKTRILILKIQNIVSTQGLFINIFPHCFWMTKVNPHVLFLPGCCQYPIKLFFSMFRCATIIIASFL